MIQDRGHWSNRDRSHSQVTWLNSYDIHTISHVDIYLCFFVVVVGPLEVRIELRLNIYKGF